jgi:hypothetical protein
MIKALRKFFREAGIIISVMMVVPVVFIVIVLLQQLWLAIFGWAPFSSFVASLS